MKICHTFTKIKKMCHVFICYSKMKTQNILIRKIVNVETLTKYFIIFFRHFLEYLQTLHMLATIKHVYLLSVLLWI